MEKQLKIGLMKFKTP